MRETILLREGWRFHEGGEDIPTPRHKGVLYNGAKLESKLYGFASTRYSTNPNHCAERWDEICVPHDFIVRHPPSPDYAMTLGGFAYGEAWYRRTLCFDECDVGRRIIVCFGAVATHCIVYFNGTPVAESRTAYTPFEAELTDLIRPGESNLLAVRILPTEAHEGWWYTGGGIIREVTLVKTDVTAVDVRGVWVRPVKMADDCWRCEIETRLVRSAGGEDIVTLEQRIGDRTVFDEVTVPGYGTVVHRQQITVCSPHLWDVDAPHLYTAQTRISRSGELIDEVETTFGFRTAEFRADGFYLNGRRVQLKGFSCHEDYGILGRVVPASIADLRIRLLQESGANAYRCAHYPHSDATMDALDRRGVLTMAECRHFSPTPEALAQLEVLIRRDRNHPSVVVWSVGNEEPTFAAPTGAAVARRMQALVRRLDPDRAVTVANDKRPHEAPVMDVFDEVLGVNYNQRNLDAIHEKHPDQTVILTECAASGTTRGHYDEIDPVAGFVGGYDRQCFGWSNSAVDAQRYIAEHPWIAGCFQWAGFEYRGEAEWPRLCSQSGAIDLFLQKKDLFYLMRAIWQDEPQCHILPHWNFTGREGEIIEVMVYTNCAEIELTCNGAVQGREASGRFAPARFAVPYVPGELRAVGYDAEGHIVAEDVVVTTGRPAALTLTIDNPEALGRYGDDCVLHVTACAVDADGRIVPDAELPLTFAIAGGGTLDHTHTPTRPQILGTGSSVCDPEPPQKRERHMRAGAAACAVRVPIRTDGSRAYLVVRSPGLASASVEL
ncbi:MAG: DUF4982 domain-containing protein [Clostridia bacterium]|nr:DUF4982 domain-containing protein [Clostridia bacterium]